MSIILCVFGTRIDSYILQRQIELCKPNKIIAYTDVRPDIKENSVDLVSWEELDFKIPESSYSEWKCHYRYCRHCIDKIQNMIPEEDYEKIIYMFENNLFFDFSKKIIFPEIISIFFLEICPEISFTESIHIMTDTHIKIKDGIQPLKDLEIDVRKKLFEKLYGKKVCDFKNFSVNSEYFKNKKIFFIISVINFLNPDKSVYTADERLKQTQKQIESIRENVTDSVVLLLETSPLTFSQMKFLTPDFLILYDKDPQTYHYAHEHISKHITEAYMLTQILPMFKNVEYTHFCKFGGRYHLHKTFDEKEFFGEYITLRKIEKGFDGKNKFFETVLYSVPKKYEENLINIMNRCICVITHMNLDIERVFAVETLREDIPITSVKFLRICGNYAGNAIFNWI